MTAYVLARLKATADSKRSRHPEAIRYRSQHILEIDEGKTARGSDYTSGKIQSAENERETTEYRRAFAALPGHHGTAPSLIVTYGVGCNMIPGHLAKSGSSECVNVLNMIHILLTTQFLEIWPWMSESNRGVHWPVNLFRITSSHSTLEALPVSSLEAFYCCR